MDWRYKPCFYVQVSKPPLAGLALGPFQEQVEAAKWAYSAPEMGGSGFHRQLVLLAQEVDKQAALYTWGVVKCASGIQEGLFNSKVLPGMPWTGTLEGCALFGGNPCNGADYLRQERGCVTMVNGGSAMAKAAAAKDLFTAGYRFTEGGRTSAILDRDGKLTLKDSEGGLEVFSSWKDYVKEVMGDTPATGEDEIVSQLSLTLGTPDKIPGAEPTGDSNKKENANMATAAKKVVVAAPAKKAAPAAAKQKKEAVQNPCTCGCGTMTGGNFAPGHDARVHGWGKKIAAGLMKYGDVPASAQKYLKEHGVKQGIAVKAAS